MKVLLLAFLSLSSPGLVLAQGNGVSPTGTGGSHVIQGHVYLPSGRRAENVQVKLQSFGASDLSVMSSANGEFTFRNLRPGQYTVTVEAGKEFESAEERVFIDTDINLGQVGIASSTSRPNTIVIHLEMKRDGQEGRASVVSAASLSEVPEPARKLYEKGLSLGQAGDSKKAIESLKEAVSLYPTFLQALDELGVHYLKLGQADKAIESLMAAVKVDDDAFRPNLNLGIALLETRQFAAAESQLKSALKINNASAIAHMYLGIALISDKKLAEAQTELEAAVSSNAPEVAKSHYYLGGIYWGNREYSRAADHLETYLKLAPKAPEAEKVRQTIKELRQQR